MYITKPIVSVILPTHNRAKLLLRSINSVLSQTFGDLECLVIDDASHDETEQLVKSIMEQDCRLQYYRHEFTKYASGARNTGLSHARGKYIAYHDDDDEWLPTKLEKQVALLDKLPLDYGCVYCWADFVDNTGNVTGIHKPSLQNDVYAKTLVDNAIGCTPSLIIRREIAEKAGGWNEQLRTEEDNEYIIRLCKICKVDFVPAVLVKIHYAHLGDRVSTPLGQNGIQYALDSIVARYALFSKERRKYRKQASALESRMGNLYGRLGDLRASINHFVESLKLAPFSIEPYRMMLSLIKWYVLSGRNL